MITKRRTTHWKRNTKVYRAYSAAKHRCENPNNISYNNYWAIGVKFMFNSFQEFYEEIGDAPWKSYSIDRIDVNWNYQKWNVRWATNIQQANNKRNMKFISYKWKNYTLTTWCRLLGLNYRTTYYRIRKWWEVCDAFEKPIRSSRKDA